MSSGPDQILSVEQLSRQVELRLELAREEVQRLEAALAALTALIGHRGDAPAQSAPVATQARPARPAARLVAADQPPPDAEQRPAVAGTSRHAILEALAAGRTMTAGEVADATGRTRSAVNQAIQTMVKRGELVKAQRGYAVPAVPAAPSVEPVTEPATEAAVTAAAPDRPNGDQPAEADRPSPAMQSLRRELDAGLRSR